MAMNTLAPAEMRPHARAAAQLLKALAHEERLMILCNLLEGERTAGEFTRLSRTQTIDATQRIEHCRDHCTPAMNMKFRDVFARGAVRPRKPERHRFVDGAAVEIAEGGELGKARRGQFSAEPLNRRAGLRS